MLSVSSSCACPRVDADSLKAEVCHCEQTICGTVTFPLLPVCNMCMNLGGGVDDTDQTARTPALNPGTGALRHAVSTPLF